MKRISYVVFLLFIVVQGRVVSGADLLTGVTRLSCEALLCLSSPARPGACNPALSHYFAIKKITWRRLCSQTEVPEQVSDGFAGMAREVADDAPRNGRPGSRNGEDIPGVRVKIARNKQQLLPVPEFLL